MCNDLETALEAQETLGADTTAGANMLFKAALKSMRKQGQEMKQIAQELKDHVDESGHQLAAVVKDVAEIKAMVLASHADATKWQLVIQICKALFGDVKRCIITTVWVALILGAVHFSEIIDLLKVIAG